MRACIFLALACVSAWASSLPDAVRDGDRAAAIALLKQHADVNAPEPDGTTALHWAVREDDREMVDRLIKAGANVKAANRYGVTPLYLACVNGSAPMIAKLLDAGADANSATTEGETALMTVARNGNVEAAKVLLAHGADVEVERAMAAADAADVGGGRVASGNGAGVDRARRRRERALEPGMALGTAGYLGAS